MTEMIPVIALILSIIMGAIELWKWLRDRKSSRIAELLKQANAEETRESIAIANAERAVLMCGKQLANYANDNESLRNRVRLLEQEVADLRRQIKDMR